MFSDELKNQNMSKNSTFTNELRKEISDGSGEYTFNGDKLEILIKNKQKEAFEVRKSS